MDFTVHNQVLLAVFVVAAIMGAVVNKTNFCTMGAVSDWVNIGDTGRMRAWLFAMALALIGVLGLESTATVSLGSNTFPPYRTAQFAWLRYIVGGLLFGIGMTLASGCGNKTLVRVGNGNLKSLVVLVVAAIAAYFMLWSALFEKAFVPWIAATTINLSNYGMPDQQLSTVLAGMFGMKSAAGFQLAVAVAVAAAMFAFVFNSEDFRGSRDNILGGG
ncbi:MAG: YeeE/YedE family protein, partial [Betaproteobacteria bacterium]|nr:YeeE/YedE family protein [Betaproteobacteria bacterium]